MTIDKGQYRRDEVLPSGRRITIRALKPSDRAHFLSALDRTTTQSIYNRFFGVRRKFTEEEIVSFVNVDFISNVAIVAVIAEDGKSVIAGGGRYVGLSPEIAEIAFLVVDRYQRQGIGAALLRHLAAIARQAGIKTFVAEVLPQNTPMLRLFQHCGLCFSAKRGSGVLGVTLTLQ